MVWDVVRNLLAEEFSIDPDEITGETDFYEDLSADSLDMVELALACEEEFDIEIKDNRKNWSITTVGELVAFLESQIEK